jgi:hypothetical protein
MTYNYYQIGGKLKPMKNKKKKDNNDPDTEDEDFKAKQKAGQ